MANLSGIINQHNVSIQPICVCLCNSCASASVISGNVSGVARPLVSRLKLAGGWPGGSWQWKSAAHAMAGSCGLQPDLAVAARDGWLNGWLNGQPSAGYQLASCVAINVANILNAAG